MSGPIDIAAEAVMERHNDLSACPYYQTADDPDVPTETCSFGCYDEPQCVTCSPGEEGWPVEDIRRRYAPVLAEVEDPGLGVPSEDDYLDAIAVLEALHGAGWSLVRVGSPDPTDLAIREWKPEAAS